MKQHGLFTKLDDLMHGINSMFAKSANHYCRLETGVGESTLIADDGSMITVLELHGMLKLIGASELRELLDRLEHSLISRFTDNGHLLQLVFEFDPDESRREVAAALRPSRITAQNLGLDVDVMMDDWEESIARWCSVEKIWLVAWTRASVLAPAEQKPARKKMARNIQQAPAARGAQTVGKVMTDIIDVHRGYVSSLMDVFTAQEMNIRIMSSHEAVWWIRHSVDAEFTDRGWRALLPGDPLPMLHKESGRDNGDMSGFLYPALKRQIFPRDAETLAGRYVRIGERIHAPLFMALPPQKPTPFQALFKRLANKRIPWRASFLIDPRGIDGLAWKTTLSSIFHFASSSNRQFNHAVQQLRDRVERSGCDVGFRVSFDTWIQTPGNMDDKEALDNTLLELKGRAAELATAVQGWGACEVSEVTGDPLLGVLGTIPAMMPVSPAPRAAAPLADTFLMMPFTRPGSPWRDGSTLLRTPDGKLMPFSQGSSLQAAWIDIGAAPMGGGKSVWLNTMNYGFLTQPGLSRLPHLSILDVGPSSSGLVSLIQSLLPPDKQYLATYRRLRMEPKHSINPFDTPLGCRKPLPSHKAFLVNLLSLFATPLDQDAPQDGIPGIARLAVDAAFDELSPEKNPRIYNKNVDSLVAEASQDFHIDDHTSWWEIVDYLFEKGCYHEAIRAQRYTMPLLGDVAAMARRDVVTTIYKHKTPGGEPITDFFWRACLEAIEAYPILKNPTQFDVGAAQVIALDLDEVAPRGGPEADRQTGVMYMLGRHVVGSKFFLMPADVDHMPKMYRAYHADKIDAMRQDPKRLCYDEFHRVARNSSISGQIIGDLETCTRESRKWNLHIGLYSQDVKDYPEILLELATNKFILGAGSPKSIEEMGDRFGLNKAARLAVKNIGKPGAHGANMVAIFTTDKGTSVQFLTNTIGMQALWAFSSTAEDVAVRNQLYKILGVKRTLPVLAKHYPGGVKKFVEQRRLEVSERGLDDSVDVIQEIVDRMAEEATV